MARRLVAPPSCNNQRPNAAIAIRTAVADHTGAVRNAIEYLSVVMLAPDEEDVRQILGAMMMAFHAQPTQTSGFFIDTLSARSTRTSQTCRRARRWLLNVAVEKVAAGD